MGRDCARHRGAATLLREHSTHGGRQRHAKGPTFERRSLREHPTLCVEERGTRHPWILQAARHGRRPRLGAEHDRLCRMKKGRYSPADKRVALAEAHTSAPNRPCGLTVTVSRALPSGRLSRTSPIASCTTSHPKLRSLCCTLICARRHVETSHRVSKPRALATDRVGVCPVCGWCLSIETRTGIRCGDGNKQLAVRWRHPTLAQICCSTQRRTASVIQSAFDTSAKDALYSDGLRGKRADTSAPQRWGKVHRQPGSLAGVASSRPGRLMGRKSDLFQIASLCPQPQIAYEVSSSGEGSGCAIPYLVHALICK